MERRSPLDVVARGKLRLACRPGDSRRGEHFRGLFLNTHLFLSLPIRKIEGFDRNLQSDVQCAGRRCRFNNAVEGPAMPVLLLERTGALLERRERTGCTIYPQAIQLLQPGPCEFE